MRPPRVIGVSLAEVLFDESPPEAHNSKHDETDESKYRLINGFIHKSILSSAPTHTCAYPESAPAMPSSSAHAGTERTKLTKKKMGMMVPFTS